jgi:ATP adenylyltransferase/5',5'''-P-1,P-4-tetraphosphate phosphorylase II
MESRQIFSIFEGDEGGTSLSSLCHDLLAEQRASWSQLRQGYQALKAAEIRDVSCPGYTLKVQWNPQRIVSSAARVDPASIRERPCFLCRKNLPEAQRAILYRKEYVVLCNPAPIFSQHYTISHVLHRPQSIEPALTAFLTLMRDFSPHFTVLYNGPRSGASAPDHQHFQAAPAGVMPVEADICADGKRQLLKRRDGVDVFKAEGLGRAILVLKGARQDHVASALLNAIAAMRAAFSAVDEPMLNLLGSYREDHWMILIFPRARHRPKVYDLEGEAQILITPASVEMGGFFITPLEKDFRTVDAELIKHIFQDVSVDEKVMEWIVDAL